MKAKVAATSDMPAPAQKLRRAQLWAEQTAIVADIAALDAALEEAEEEKRRIVKEYRKLSAELKKIPTGRPSLGGERGIPSRRRGAGMLRRRK